MKWLGKLKRPVPVESSASGLMRSGLTVASTLCAEDYHAERAVATDALPRFLEHRYDRGMQYLAIRCQKLVPAVASRDGFTGVETGTLNVTYELDSAETMHAIAS